MVTSNKNQFDPQTQFDQALTELDIAMQAGRAAIDRMEWLKGKIAAEYRAMQDAADAADVWTEAEFAVSLKIENPNSTDPKQSELALGTLRRRHDLPHCKIGVHVRYTRAQRAACLDILTISGKATPAAMRRAA